MVGQGIMSPVLPLFALQLGVGATAIGFIVGIFGLARLFVNLPAGILAERIGKNLVMGGGLMLNAVGLFLTGTAQSALMIALWRFVSGVGSAMNLTGAYAFMAGISTPNNRGTLMSLQQGSVLVGASIGPVIGGFFAGSLGLRWPFYIAGMFASLAALLVLLYLLEKRSQEAPDSRQPESVFPEMKGESWDLQATGMLLGSPTFFLVSMLTLVVFFTRTGSRQTLLPLLAVEHAGMSVTRLGILFTFMAAINMFMVLPAGMISDRFGRKAVILPGALMTMGGLSLFAWANSEFLFFVAGGLQGFGTGVIGPVPGAYAADLAPPGKMGVTMGLYRTFGDIGFIIGPVLLGWISEVLSGCFSGISGYSIAMEFNAFLIGLTAVLLVWIGKETVGRPLVTKEVSRVHPKA